MKIVVTGSSGRIGRAIHFNLCQDHEVIGVDRSPSSAASLVGDICDYDLLAGSFEGADAVIHVAALHAPHVGLQSDEEFARINVKGTKTVVRAMKACGVPRLVFTSTTALYGHASQHPDESVWVDESTVPQPRTIYHSTKLEAERYLGSVASENLRIVTLRMSRCFPEPAPLMAAYRLHRGIDARDVALGHRLAIARSGPAHQVFILSGETPFQREDSALLKTNAREVLELRCPALCRVFEQRGWPLPKSIDRVYDSSRALAELGWRPRFGFEEVIRQLDRDSFEVLPPKKL